MKIHPRLAALIYSILIIIITFIFEKIFKINIFSTKVFFIVFILGGCAVILVSWKKSND